MAADQQMQLTNKLYNDSQANYGANVVSRVGQQQEDYLNLYNLQQP